MLFYCWVGVSCLLCSYHGAKTRGDLIISLTKSMFGIIGKVCWLNHCHVGRPMSHAYIDVIIVIFTSNSYNKLPWGQRVH